MLRLRRLQRVRSRTAYNQTAVPRPEPLVKTDTLFYRLFKDRPDLVFQLLGETTPPEGTYEFGSQEVKQLAFRIDGVLNPSPDAVDLPLVFVEVQGYRDQKKILYHSFFAEIFLYLRDYQPVQDWLGILIFTQRNLDPQLPLHFQDYASSARFQRVYLDELPVNLTEQSLELRVLQLIGLDDAVAPERARQLVERVRHEVTDGAERERVIELVLTTLVYKFPTLEREAIRQMLGLDELKQTRFYQEVKEEGVEEVLARAVPSFLRLGLSAEQIAEELGVEVETIARIIRQQQSQQN